MDKLKLETPDLTAANIQKLAELFPGVVAEGKVNFDLLRTMLGDDVMGDEAYEFTWVGKREAIREAGRPIRKTLRPCVEESKNWDTTENLYIEGDNLEVLKLLQESYLGKVKMIYIDPPYNTGNDFVYRDNFTSDKDEYDEASGVYDEDGDRLFRNTESNGRFHSDWCSMMYPRLVLARNLLSNDGVIFISVDDNEKENIKKICDEIFGEKNYINEFSWVSNVTGRQISGFGAAKTWESIFSYAKNTDFIYTFDVNIDFAKAKMPDAYKGFNKNIKIDKYGSFVIGDTLYNHNRKFNEETRKNLIFSIFYNPNTEEIITGNIGEVKKDFIEIPPHKNGDGVHKYHAWRWSRQKIANESYNLIVKKNKNGYEIYTKIREFTTTLLKDIITNISNGDSEVQKLFDNKRFFDYPKSIDLIQLLINTSSDKEPIILDFFSGSATTAHAVMQLNAEDDGKRKFIMVQLPEVCAPDSEAAKAGYKNICEIGKERIRRAGEKIRAEVEAAKAAKADGEIKAVPDIGFRVLKLDDSNMKDVYYAAGEYTQGNLQDMVSNIKDDRTDMDLLYGCLLDWGLPLSLPHTQEQIDGVTVHTYNDGDLIACFAPRVSEKVVKEIAGRQPLRVVFRDSSFASSPDKINVEEIFKLFAPHTTVKVI